MKYWDSGLNAPGSRTFRAIAHIVAVIGWKRSTKERTGQTEFGTKFAAKLNFDAPLKPRVLLFPVLKCRPLCDQTGPNRGFQCRLWLTLRMTLLARSLQGLGPISETTIWNQVNAIKNSISCDFNKNATRDLVPQRLPMTAGFTKDIFRTPQFTARPSSPLLALRRTFQDYTNDGTTIESTAGFIKDMSGDHKWQHHDNAWLTFVWQNLRTSF